VDIIKDATWFANKKLAGGGIMMDMGQYFMDCVLNIVGWPAIDSVAASMFKGFPHELPPEVVYDVEEHATVFARAGAATFTFDFANISNHKPVRRMMILGTKGGILMDDDYFKFYAEKGPWQQMEHKTSWRDKTGGNDYAYLQLMKAVRGEDAEIGTTPRQALAITELTEMAYRSDAEKREVKRSEL
jgi:predicted dehydrogenase